MSAASRLMREEREVASQSVPVVFAEPEESDILHWHGLILGPPGTPYCLGLFHVSKLQLMRYTGPVALHPASLVHACSQRRMMRASLLVPAAH